MAVLANSLLPMWRHQKDAYIRFKEIPSFGLFFEQGTGKTLTTINVLRYRYSQSKRVLRTLILGPPIVVENWRREWRMFSQVRSQLVVTLTGPMKKRMFTFAEARAVYQDFICITNYEALLKHDLYCMIRDWGPEVIVVDESHRVKNPTAKRSKLLYELSKIANDKIILTGTPILKSAEDLFMQFKIMNPTIFGVNYYQFRATYFWDRNSGMPKQSYFPNWVIRPGAMDDLNEKVNAYTAVVKKQDCLSLPPFVRQTVAVELPSSMRIPYQMMKQHLIAEVGEGVCSASLALTKALRLMQIASGYIPVAAEVDGKRFAEPKNIKFTDNPKAVALRELLTDLTPTNKVIVWAVFKENYHTIRNICDGLGVKYVEISGERTPKQKNDAVDNFNNDPDVRVLIGHPGSGGIGINLVAASYSIFYSRNFSLEYDLQAEARNYRGGSQRHARVTRIDIVAKDTIDEIIAEKLSVKQKVSDRILINLLVEEDSND